MFDKYASSLFNENASLSIGSKEKIRHIVQGRKRLPLSCDKILFATFFNFRLLRAPDKTTPALIVGILPQDRIDAHTDSVRDLRLYTTLSVRAILFFTSLTFLHYLASALLSF